MHAALLTLAAVGIAAPVPKAEAKLEGDLALLQGTWDWDPKVQPDLIRPQILLERLVIKGDTLTFHYRLDAQTWATDTKFKLDPATDPKGIDFTPADGGNGNAGKWYQGRYELSDGKLRICYRGPDSTRPRGFADKRDGTTGTMFLHLVPGVKKDEPKSDDKRKDK